MSDGERFGRYLLLAPRAPSAHGEVWEAALAGTPVRVALTLLRTVPEARTRAALVRDLRAAARIRSPNVARVVDAGVENGTWWVAHEDVPGARPIAGLPASEAGQVEQGIRRALADLAAEPDGPLVHGDLGPDAIVVDPRGRIVVLHLGLRSLVGDAAEDDARAVARALDALGGPQEPAPEPAPAVPAAPEPVPPPLRADLVERVHTQLVDGSRCVALCGPVGSGRVPLVYAIAARAGKRVGPIVAVPLAHVAPGPSATEALVCAVASALGVDPDLAARPLHLGRILGRRGRLALLLDGIDGVRDALPSVLDDWLRAAPELTIFCTGREAADPATRTALGPLSADDAAAVFTAAWVARADEPETAPLPSGTADATPAPAPPRRGPSGAPISASPGTADPPDDLPALAAAVDGRPLALQLLAASGGRAGLLLGEVRRRRLDADGSDAGMYAAIEVAVERGPRWTRTALGQLATFEGAADLAQLGAQLDLAAFAGPDTPGPFAPAVVVELASRGFLQRQGSRWRVREAVRQWSAARAGALQRELDLLRHRATHLRLGSPGVLRAIAEGIPGFRAPELLAELEDVLAALARALDDPAPEAPADVVTLLDAAASIGGAHLPPRRAYELGRRAAAKADTPRLRARAEYHLFPLAAVLGRAGEGPARRDAAVAAATEAGDTSLAVAIRLRSGSVAEVEEALALARRTGDPQLADALVARAELFHRVGRVAAAREALDDAGAATSRDRALRSRAALLQGRILAELTEPEAAATAFEAALHDLHAMGRDTGRGVAHAGLGAALLELGRVDEALGHLSAAGAAARADADAVAEAATHDALAEAARWCGRYDAATKHLDDAALLREHLQDTEGYARSLAARGRVAFESGRDGVDGTSARLAWVRARDLGNTRAWTHAELGLVELDLPGSAPELLRDDLRPRLLEVLAQARRQGDRVAVGRALGALGRLAIRLGEPDTGRARLEAASAELRGRSLGWHLEAERALAVELGARGEVDPALAQLEAAISAARAARFSPSLGLLLAARADLLAGRDRAAEAASDLAEANLLARTLPIGPMSPLSRALAR